MTRVYHNYQDPCFRPGWIGGGTWPPCPPWLRPWIKDLCKNGHTFEVVYAKKFDQSVNAGVKISPLIRIWVIRRGHLFTGNASCPVTEFLLRNVFIVRRLVMWSKAVQLNLNVQRVCSLPEIIDRLIVQ